MSNYTEPAIILCADKASQDMQMFYQLPLKNVQTDKELNDNPKNLMQLIDALDVRTFYLKVIDDHYQVQHGN